MQNESINVIGTLGNPKKIDEERREKKFVGEVTDRLIDAKTEKVIEERVYNNLVVDACSVLIAGLMKGTLSGVQYFAVGSGSSSWSNDTFPSPVESDTKLLAETYRKAIETSNVVFINSENVVSQTPTNRIQITVVFNESEANGELRELGIFGGDATSAKDSGYMINRKTHALIYKTSGMKLERIIRFTF